MNYDLLFVVKGDVSYNFSSSPKDKYFKVFIIFSFIMIEERRVNVLHINYLQSNCFYSV